MIKYRITDSISRTVTVSLEASHRNSFAPLVILGDESLAIIVSELLSRSYGAFGHGIGESTSPIDLDAALKSSNVKVIGQSFKEMDIELLEGEELVSSYDPEIPEGAVT